MISPPLLSSNQQQAPTVWELWLAEVQVVAGPGRVVLGAHGELHALDVLLEVVEGAKHVLHALRVRGVHAVVGQSLVGLGLVRLPPGLPGALLHGQGLDDVAGGTLQRETGGVGWGGG